MVQKPRQMERWNTRLGVVLAVAGSAVGLGNFLRFPGQVAEYGGGAFMIAYFLGFLLVGLPICWAEWVMGRSGGRYGFNSCPSILAVIARHPVGKYLGLIGLIIPTVIYMYYVYIEAWCLGYAVNFALGNLDFESISDSRSFFQGFIGAEENGGAVGFGIHQVGIFLLVVIALNFFLIYRGIGRGIEWFCKFAMPTLVVLAIGIVIWVMTLGAPDAEKPENSIYKGLGFMWNPEKVHLEFYQLGEDGKKSWVLQDMLVTEQELEEWDARAADDPDVRLVEITIWSQLARPQLWLAAVGQIFFSLSVGFGIILTYASYLRDHDDVVVSGLAASAANEVCEIGLGGMITIPAAVAFLGIAGIAGMTGTFALGFNVIPMVFASMGSTEILGLTIHVGAIIGAAFFFLLFLAAVTSSLSMLQPGIAFLEEYLLIGRKQSVLILGALTTAGTLFVVYFSAGLKALDTMDFWVGTFLIFILATIEIIFFGWVLGVEKGFKEAKKGSIMGIPPLFKGIMKYVAPAFLLTIFVFWVRENLFTPEGASRYVVDLISKPNLVAWLSIGVILLTAILAFLVIYLSPLKFPFRSREATPDRRTS